MRRQPTAFRIVLLAGPRGRGGLLDSRPGGKVVTPTPTKIVGKVRRSVTPKAGTRAIRRRERPSSSSQGCGACHTFKAAGSTGKVGPDLDKLAPYAQAANQASLKDFVSTSITDPGAYVEKGYPKGVMPPTYSSRSGARALRPRRVPDDLSLRLPQTFRATSRSSRRTSTTR